MNEKERQKIISSIRIDLYEIATLSKSIYYDGLTDKEVIDLSNALSNAWLILYRSKKRGNAIEVSPTPRIEPKEQPFSKKVEEIETLFKKIDEKKQ